jgi:hypothetical protein
MTCRERDDVIRQATDKRRDADEKRADPHFDAPHVGLEAAARTLGMRVVWTILSKNGF